MAWFLNQAILVYTNFVAVFLFKSMNYENVKSI